MELIRVFLGILLLVCLFLSVNFGSLQSYFKEKDMTLDSIKTEKVLGIDVRDFKGKVKIIDVLEYTPARYAGLEIGDRILKINGQKVESASSFIDEVELLHDASPINLTIYRVDSNSVFSVDVIPLKISSK